MLASLYFYFNSNKKQWFKYHWKGFLLISIGFILILLKLMVQIPKPFEFIRKVFALLTSFYGLYLIILGERKKRTFQEQADRVTHQL